ncbi:MAG: hypothetical protein QW813_00295 [Candidatus Aenigmatarchaeota archaeon]
MGKYVRVIDNTLLVHLNGNDDRRVVEEWLLREDNDRIKQGYISNGCIFLVLPPEYNPRRIASLIGSAISKYHRFK